MSFRPSKILAPSLYPPHSTYKIRAKILNAATWNEKFTQTEDAIIFMAIGDMEKKFQSWSNQENFKGIL